MKLHFKCILSISPLSSLYIWCWDIDWVIIVYLLFTGLAFILGNFFERQYFQWRFLIPSWCVIQTPTHISSLNRHTHTHKQTLRTIKAQTGGGVAACVYRAQRRHRFPGQNDLVRELVFPGAAVWRAMAVAPLPHHHATTPGRMPLPRPLLIHKQIIEKQT